ncbi:MAG: E3 binding domain-containing protein, partial [Rhizobiaceae bacterium]|nr:E3 binding domain-containing protein [Rhizobiaceae bacterium]
MATEVILPRVDMDMATGSISRWFVGEGERVEKGAVLFEIETDKAAMEIDAPASGRVHRLAADDGTALPVGSRVAWILAEGETAPQDAPVGKVEASAAVAQEASNTAKSYAALPGSTAPAPGSVSEAAVPAGEANVWEARPRATPLARRLARDRQIDLRALSGSGPNGRIQSRDVETA